MSGREDKVFRIQHIQNAELRSIHTVHLTAGGSHSLISSLHLRDDMVVYHFLITTQFGSMIATDTLMPIRRIIFIKRITGETDEVQHTVIQGCILKNYFVCLSLNECFHLFGLRNKQVVMQITLVDSPHIYQA